MKALLSIKPEYVKQILSGRKKYEYRKRIFKKNVETVIIYSSMPEGKIIGEFLIEMILLDTPDNIWEKTKNYSGISKKGFRDYFSGKNKAYAIKIGEFTKYETPINPYTEFENFQAPQSFKYV